MITKDKKLYVTDFGVSQKFKSKDDTTAVKLGTMLYHPPEVYSSKEFKAKPCDIWALGCIIYQMIYGKLPYRATNRSEYLDKITNE